MEHLDYAVNLTLKTIVVGSHAPWIRLYMAVRPPMTLIKVCHSP